MAKKRKKEARKDNRVKVNWVLCLIISVIFGELGVDRFLMGKIGTGILKLITFGGIGIWWLVDVILIATKYEYKGVKWE
jgi:TM2 domain-containing membrane protein YozV